MEKPGGSHIRFSYVELLFALTVAEIAIQFAEVVSKVETVSAGAAAYAHLILALTLVTTSWVGWSISNAPGAKRDVHAVFSLDFLVLLVDVLLVIFYFIVVKGVDIDKAPDGSMTIIPSAANESLWIVVIFAGYFVWDIITKAVIVDETADGRSSVVSFKFFSKSFWNRGWISAACLFLSIIAWYLLHSVTTSAQVMLADVTLLALVLLFRAAKERAWTWAGVLSICFVAPVAIIRFACTGIT